MNTRHDVDERASPLHARLRARLLRIVFNIAVLFLPPGRPVLYAGYDIGIRARRGENLLRTWCGRHHKNDQPRYEEALVSALDAHVRPGAHVVVVGGGLGVTTTAAAVLASPTGRVTCYEANRTAVRRVKRALKRNGPCAKVEVIHAIVGRDANGSAAGRAVSVVAPAVLPHCDVLELDCEGAELTILRDLTHRPPVVVIETHGVHGASTAAVAELLSTSGYAVSDLGWAEPDLMEDCARNDIRVLVGLRGGCDSSSHGHTRSPSHDEDSM